MQLVSFKLQNEEYGVDILAVQEINRILPITKVPNSPYFIEGVINLRGRIIPVVDLRKKFGFTERKPDKDTRIMVVDVEGKIVGLVVDGVSEVLRLTPDAIEPPPLMIADLKTEYIRGVGKLKDRLLILLDLKMVLSKNEKELLVEAQELSANTAT